MNISKKTLKILDIVVLLFSIVLIIVVSLESFSDINLIMNPRYIEFQLIICIIYLIDFLIRLITAPKGKRVHFTLRHLFYIIVSIPYLNIMLWCDMLTDSGTYFLLKIIPLIRGAYGLYIIISWLSKSKISNIFYSYLLIVLSFTYLSAIALFITEKGVNYDVANFWNAICWACMNVTTVGAAFFAKQPLGQLLAILLPASGMVLFPIFTVYVTNKFNKLNK